MPPYHQASGSTLDLPTHTELEGRRILLAGVADGTGEAIARSFARQRTRLVLHSAQSPARASALADSLVPQAAAVRLFAAGIGAEQAASERLGRAALGAFGGLDLVVNIIGGQVPAEARPDPSADIEDVVAADLRPAMVLSRAVADHARNSGQAATVIHACLLPSGHGAAFGRYALLKSGVEAMAQDQARRWFSHDICVYAFMRGLTEPFDASLDADNVVPARDNFEAALCALLLNAAGGRSRWLNGLTVSIPS